MKKMLLGCLLMCVMVVAHAEPMRVVFQCTLSNHQTVTVQHEPVNDVFNLSYGDNNLVPQINVMKYGNDIGTSREVSGDLLTYHREIFFLVGDYFYTVEYTNTNGVLTGNFHIAQSTRELTYQGCQPGKLTSQFEEEDLFKNMTLVD